MKYYLRGKSLEHLILNPKKRTAKPPPSPPSTAVHRRPPAVHRRPPPSICTVGQYGRRMLYNVHEESVVGGRNPRRNPLHCQTRQTDKLRNWVAELFPMDRLVERIVAMEVGEARVARKAVALGLASVDQELALIIKTPATIHTHTIFVIFHIFFIRFAIFQLTQKHKEEAFVTVVIATSIAAFETGVRSLMLFVIVGGSIVKPQRSRHSGSHSHFLRSFSCLLKHCYAWIIKKSISILLRLWMFCVHQKKTFCILFCYSIHIIHIIQAFIRAA